eukprot:TRINITY_DN8813_c0_g1_i1.p1 TRINITY_DN8813_c0_g1~~TRINITY_DN8813_c0_g1_i1.p1  ORF type:complete len:482 (+),score=93.44 TRINITY_DN8813_c0_g1_i1:45-1490(+)
MLRLSLLTSLPIASAHTRPRLLRTHLSLRFCLCRFATAHSADQSIQGDEEATTVEGISTTDTAPKEKGDTDKTAAKGSTTKSCRIKGIKETVFTDEGINEEGIINQQEMKQEGINKEEGINEETERCEHEGTEGAKRIFRPGKKTAISSGSIQRWNPSCALLRVDEKSTSTSVWKAPFPTRCSRCVHTPIISAEAQRLAGKLQHERLRTCIVQSSARAWRVQAQIQYFLDLGFCERDILKALETVPKLASMRFSSFREKIDFQMENHILNKGRLRLHGGVMGLKTSTLEGRVTFLKGMGLTPKELQRAMLNAPAFLTYSLQTRIPQFIDIFTKMQLSHNEIMRIIIKCPTLVGLSMASIEKKIKTLTEFGFTRNQVIRMIQAHPIVFGYRMEQDAYVLKKLMFYLNVVGLDPETLVKNPSLLCYDFQNRILFRYEVAKLCMKPFFPSRHVLISPTRFASDMGLTDEAISDLRQQFKKNKSL